MGLGLVVGGSVASCANGDPTGLGGEAASASTAGSSQAGKGGTASAGRGQGGMSTGGVTATGGVSASGGSGGAGTGTGGSAGGSSGNGVGGSVSSGGTTGGITTGGASGSGAMSGMAGSTASGGTTGGACDDLPPNNGQTCVNAVSYGWCTQDWLGNSCRRTCGKCTGGGTGGTNGTGGMNGGSGNSGGNVAPPPDIQGGMQAWGSRYWDCCKPACGWSANVGGRSPAKSCDKSGNSLGDVNAKNACESGGSAFACWSDRPWSVGDKLSYGFVAKNDTCGRCYHVQFTGTSHNGSQDMSTQALAGKHMIVQVINNGAIASDQFDFLIPGGGVGLLDACSNQWGTSDLGAQYGGFLAGCNGDKTCVKNKCQQVFAGKQDLLDGCDWFLGWFAAADNPNFTYEKIACPAEITQRSGLSDPG